MEDGNYGNHSNGSRHPRHHGARAAPSPIAQRPKKTPNRQAGGVASIWQGKSTLELGYPNYLDDQKVVG